MPIEPWIRWAYRRTGAIIEPEVAGNLRAPCILRAESAAAMDQTAALVGIYGQKDIGRNHAVTAAESFVYTIHLNG